jgi:coenzyme F420-0:L-glutamate ligase/coenzyme F420-1:gamma-L-glutamate ligase
MLPSDGFAAARDLRMRLRRLLREDLSVVIVDSRVTPLRLGTVGIALGYSGFKGIHDFRGKSDLFGRRIRMTQHDLADDLAATAHLLMGEGRERIGAVLIRHASLTSGSGSKSEIQLSRNRCLFAGVLTSRVNED